MKTLNHLINRVKNHDGSEEIISYDENDSIIKRVLIKKNLRNSLQTLFISRQKMAAFFTYPLLICRKSTD